MPKEVTNLEILGYLETIHKQVQELQEATRQIWHVLNEIAQADQSDLEDEDEPSSQRPRLV